MSNSIETLTPAGDFRVIALVSAFNEGDVIYHVIGDLIANGIEVYLLDNRSTDNTVSEAGRWLGRGLLQIESFPGEHGPKEASEQYLWKAILQRKEELAATLGADWYIHHDADEFRESPWAGLTLKEAIRVVDTLGYSAINFELLNFRPVDDRFVPGEDVRNCLPYYDDAELFNLNQLKAWKNTGAPVAIAANGGHDISFAGRSVFPLRFILRHYPIRSSAHGLRKVLRERLPRFSEGELNEGWHVQYDKYRGGEQSFLHDPATLQLYHQDRLRNSLFTGQAREIAGPPVVLQCYFADGSEAPLQAMSCCEERGGAGRYELVFDLAQLSGLTGLRLDLQKSVLLFRLESLILRKSPAQQLDLTERTHPTGTTCGSMICPVATDTPHIGIASLTGDELDRAERLLLRIHCAHGGPRLLQNIMDEFGQLHAGREETERTVRQQQERISSLESTVEMQKELIRTLEHSVESREKKTLQAVNHPDRTRKTADHPGARPYSIVPLLQEQPGRIAIHLHLYYTDLAAELLGSLAKMPFRYDLFITVVDTGAVASIEAQARQICGPLLEQLTLLAVPNRGRDIGAFLVTLGQRYRQYDYICHVHGKKSLYSGAEQKQWCSYLFDALFGNEEQLRRIFGLFAAEAKIGLVYPTTTRELPYWCHSWLSNNRSARELFSRMGISVNTACYVDYPAGSMFWARGDALQQLFDLGLSFDDFPAEPIPNDGTLCHAIERSFCIAAYLQGYTFAELDPERGNFTIADGKKNLWQYWQKSSEQLERLLGSFQTISFDIFDTIITRPLLDPDHAFLLVQQRLGNVTGPGIDFPLLRREAESLARQRLQPGTDVAIHDIYACFAEISGLAEETCDRIRELEIETEFDLSLPRRGMIDLILKLQRSGRKIVLLSDMYLTAAIIRRLLARHGLDTAEMPLLVSAETGLRKDTGQIWGAYLQHIAQIHVGDNEHADIQLALDNGIPNYHVMSPRRLFELAHPRFPLAQRQTLADSIYAGPAVARLFSSPFRLNATNGWLRISDPKELGYAVFGPLLLHFTIWLYRTAREAGVTQLLFLAREGHLLQQLFDLIQERFGSGEITSTYLLCSRRGNSVAAIETDRDILCLLEDPYLGTLANLLQTRFGIDPAAAETTLPRTRLQSDTIRLPVDVEAVYRDVMEFREEIYSRARSERQAYLAYLQRTIIMDGRTTAVVDVGYGGTIQKHLHTLTGMELLGYYLVTNQKARRNPLAGLMQGCFGNFVTEQEGNCIYNYSLILEAVLTASTGQFIRFDPDGEPRFGSSVYTGSTWPVVHAVHLGIIDYVQESIGWFGEALLSQQPGQETATHFFRMMARHPEIVSPSLQEILKIDDFYVSSKVLGAFQYAPGAALDVESPEADLAFITNYLSERTRDDHVPLRSRREFEDYFASRRYDYAERLVSEKILSNISVEPGRLSITGKCDCCGKTTGMQSSWDFSEATLNHRAYVYDHESHGDWYGKVLLFREQLVCDECRLNNRQRGIFHALEKLGLQLDQLDVYAYEQTTPFYAQLARLAGSAVGSEYLHCDCQSGRIYDGIRHEDALATSFDTSSFDLLIANDVFEHVPDIEAALSEAERILRDDGVLLFSIPFDISRDATIRRARLVNGHTEHLLEPVFHGNPVSDEGSLVFYDFGWDLLDTMRKNGFPDAFMLQYYSFDHALIGGGLQFVFVGRKKSARGTVAADAAVSPAFSRPDHPEVSCGETLPHAGDREAETGRRLKQERHYAEALNHFIRAREQGDTSVYSEMGDCLAHLGRFDEAADCYTEALRRNDRDLQAHTGNGVLRLLQAKHPAAATAFSRALQLDPANARALCGLGMCRHAQGKAAEAFDLFLQSLNADHENLVALHELTVLAYELSRFDEAADCLKRYLLYHPGSCDSLFTLAGLLYKGGNHAEALDALERLLALAPDYHGGNELAAVVCGEMTSGPERRLLASGA